MQDEELTDPMTIALAANLTYSLGLTNEQVALVTKALVGKLRDTELDKAELLAYEILSARTRLLQSKLEASTHAEDKARE